jgi:hypothetical protein
MISYANENPNPVPSPGYAAAIVFYMNKDVTVNFLCRNRNSRFILCLSAFNFRPSAFSFQLGAGFSKSAVCLLESSEF